MKHLFTAFALLYLSTTLLAGPGDTTVVVSHTNVDMTWYGNYDQWGVFPAPGTSYQQVLMEYTMGCATGGCSDWDYTTVIEFLDPTGIMDSTVLSIDSISGDTTWNVFEVMRPFELGRVITPYGGYMRTNQNGYNNNWKHPFLFDITEFQHMLRDSVKIRAHYSGWSSGFSANIKFYFIEGTPPRDILHVERLYKVDASYSNSASFEANHLPPRQVYFAPNVQHAEITVATSGHGFDNNVGCAEFCQRNYQVYVDGMQRYVKSMWLDNCGLNPIYPQGGTWLYDRANWCPGAIAPAYKHNLTSFITPGDTSEIDVNLQPYTWSGTQAPIHIISSYVVSYGAFNYPVDAAVKEIISPNNISEHRRFNPVCDDAQIVVENRGANNITALTISYSVPGGPTWTHNWTGNLPYGNLAKISLPIPDYSYLSAAATKAFTVTLSSINGSSTDAVVWNNSKTSNYTTATEYTVPVYIEFRSNNGAWQNEYTIKDVNGNTVVSKGNFSNATIYRDTLNLPNGCYTFLMTDQSKNGIAWWANSEGSGYLRIRRVQGNNILFTFNPDFGTQARMEFIVNYDASSVADLPETSLDIYPNPASESFIVSITGNHSRALREELVDITGRVVIQNSISETNWEERRIDVSGLPTGIYWYRLYMEHEVVTKKVIISR